MNSLSDFGSGAPLAPKRTPFAPIQNNGQSYRVLDSQTAGLTLLPEELLIEILKGCDLPTLAKFSATAVDLNRFVSDFQIWSPIANKLSCPITTEAPIYCQVLSFIEHIQKRALAIADRPADLNQILKGPTVEEINHLHNWLKAREILVVWERLVHGVNEENPEAHLIGPGVLATSQEAIAKAAEFSGWCAANQHELAQLMTLDLSNLQLTSIPKEIGLLRDLVQLNLSNNRLASLPNEFSSLTEMHQLDLTNNQFAALPSMICSLLKLQTLKLSQNQLQSLPEGISRLSQLLTLHLCDNKFASLPRSLLGLTHLQELHASNNQLTTVPNELNQLIFLNKLKLGNNPFESLPSEIQGRFSPRSWN